MYPQVSEKLFMVCQVRNEDIDMSYVALYIIYTIYLIYTSLKQQDTLDHIYTSLKQLSTLCIIYTHPINN